MKLTRSKFSLHRHHCVYLPQQTSQLVNDLLEVDVPSSYLLKSSVNYECAIVVTDFRTNSMESTSVRLWCSDNTDLYNTDSSPLVSSDWSLAELPSSATSGINSWIQRIKFG